MKSNRYLSWYAAEYVGDEIWVSDIRFNGLFKINRRTGGCEFVGSFLDYATDDRELHLLTRRYKNKLFFYPQHARTIDVYDMQKNRFYQADGFFEREKGYSTIVDAIGFGEEITWLVPRYYDMPLQAFSLKEDAVVDMVELKQVGNVVSDSEGFLTLYPCRESENIIFPIYGTNKIGSYNPISKMENIYELPQIRRIDGTIAFDGKYIWINADRGIYCWNKLDNQLEFVCNVTREEQNWIEHISLYEGRLICIPRWLDDITVIDLQTRELKAYKVSSEILHEKMDFIWRDFKQCVVKEDTLIISPLRYREMICVNLKTGDVKTSSYKYPDNFHPYASQLVTEKNADDLEAFLSFM